MWSRRLTSRLLVVGAVLSVAIPGLAVVAEAQTCPTPPASFIRSAPATSAKTVALTFDDGPGPYLPQILKILRMNGVRATIFDTGAMDAAYPAMTRQIATDGQLLGDHTWDHAYPQDVSGGWTVSYLVNQISRTRSQQTALTGQSICYFRPPGGYQTNVLTATQQLGMSAVLWSIDPRDWTQPAYYSQSAVDAIVSAATNTGGQAHPIVLLHDGGGFRGNTVAALPRIIAWYRANGYQFVDLTGASGLPSSSTDFDGDQRGDVLGTRPDGSLTAYLGNGSGGWRGE